jgi:hypothetical protein
MGGGEEKRREEKRRRGHLSQVVILIFSVRKSTVTPKVYGLASLIASTAIKKTKITLSASVVGLTAVSARDFVSNETNSKNFVLNRP